MINVLVASKIEALPLIDYFKLTESGVFLKKTIYANALVSLCITGIGAENMRKSVNILKALRKDKAQMWINFGIAGSRDYELGQFVLAKQIHCDETGLSWTPFIPSNMPFCYADVTTVTTPKMNYQNAIVYDMEASGFIADIPQQTSVIIKLITDTPKHPWHLQTNADIQQSIDEKKTDIYCFLDLLCKHKTRGIDLTLY